jgi:hypothetical protein
MPCGARLEIGWLPVRETVSKDDEVNVSDHIDVTVKLLPVLEDEALHAILREELERRGWTREADGSLTKVFGDAVATLPAGSATVRLAVEDSAAVSASATAKANVREEDTAGQAAVREKAERDAETKLRRAADLARDKLVQKNLDRLLRVQEDLHREVAEVANATMMRSLQRRAAELGTIESTSEGRADDGSYELTITVKT